MEWEDSGARMRRGLLLLVVLATLAAAAADVARGSLVAAGTPGAETFELRNGRGRAVVTNRGSIIVRIRRWGRIRVVDIPGGRRPNRKCSNGRLVHVSPSTVEYRGRHIVCRVWGIGPWQVIVRGRRIYASGVARGSLTLDAVNEGPTGTFRIGDSDWKPWPRIATTRPLRR
jgi:hypothetical protein